MQFEDVRRTATADSAVDRPPSDIALPQYEQLNMLRLYVCSSMCMSFLCFLFSFTLHFLRVKTLYSIFFWSILRHCVLSDKLFCYGSEEMEILNNIWSRMGIEPITVAGKVISNSLKYSLFNFVNSFVLHRVTTGSNFNSCSFQCQRYNYILHILAAIYMRFN